MAQVVFPTVMDIYHVASRMRDEEVAQYLAATGLPAYDPDECTRRVLSQMGEFSFGLLDADGMPIVVGGYIETREKCFTSWMMGSEESWQKHWRTITKVSRRTMDALLNEGRAQRISDYSLRARNKAQDWYKGGLGLEFSHVERKWYANGEDANCYIKLRADNGNG